MFMNKRGEDERVRKTQGEGDRQKQGEREKDYCRKCD